jgi:hypothetical protein
VFWWKNLRKRATWKMLKIIFSVGIWPEPPDRLSDPRSFL